MLPLADDEVDLGRGAHLDRRSDGYHHLGDFTLRVKKRGGGAYTTCSSVGGGQVAADAAAGGATLTHGGEGTLWTHTRPVA